MMEYVVQTPDGPKKYKAKNQADLDSQLQKDYPDYWENLDDYSYEPLEGYSERFSEKQTKIQKEEEAKQKRYEGTENFGEWVSGAVFPLADMLARGGAEKSEIAGAATGEALLNFIPGMTASKIVGRTGLQGGKALLARGGTEGLLTVLGEEGLRRATTDEGLGAGGMLATGLASMAPDVLASGSRFGGRKARELAPDVLEYSLVPNRQTRFAQSKPDYQRMLDEGIVTKGQGTQGALDRLQEKAQPFYEARDVAVKQFDEGGGKISLADVEKEAISSLDEAGTKLSPLEKEQAKKRIRNEIKVAKKTSGGDKISAESAQGIRNEIDAKFTELKEASAERAKEKVKTAFNRVLGRDIPGFEQATKGMAPYEAMKAPITEQLSRRKPVFNLRGDVPGAGLLGAGGIGAAATGSPEVALAGLLAGLGSSGFSRLMSTPGGAAILSTIGKQRGMRAPIEGLLSPFLLPAVRSQTLED